MSNEMIERVAKAMYVEWCKRHRCLVSWDDIKNNANHVRTIKYYLSQARAAIEAIRELPDSIKNAEGIHCKCYTCGGYEEGWHKIIKDNPAVYECSAVKSGIHTWIIRADGTAYCLKCNEELNKEDTDDMRRGLRDELAHYH